MDIVNLLKNFLSNDNAQAILPLINLLKNNSFDLKRTLNALTPETLSKILETFLKNGANTQKSYTAPKTNGVAPIANIADSEIVYALNRYVGTNA